MKRAELDNLIKGYEDSFVTYDEVVSQVMQDNDCIVRCDTLLDFAIQQIEEERLFLARHILDAVDTNYEDYYAYDMSMGTVETPAPIEELTDLYDYVED